MKTGKTGCLEGDVACALCRCLNWPIALGMMYSRSLVREYDWWSVENLARGLSSSRATRELESPVTRHTRLRREDQAFRTCETLSEQSICGESFLHETGGVEDDTILPSWPVVTALQPGGESRGHIAG